MRPFEGYLMQTAMLYGVNALINLDQFTWHFAILSFLPQTFTINVILSYIMALFLFLHVSIEFPRWQMSAAYISILIVLNFHLTPQGDSTQSLTFLPMALF